MGKRKRSHQPTPLVTFGLAGPSFCGLRCIDREGDGRQPSESQFLERHVPSRRYRGPDILCDCGFFWSDCRDTGAMAIAQTARAENPSSSSRRSCLHYLSRMDYLHVDTDPLLVAWSRIPSPTVVPSEKNCESAPLPSNTNELPF